MLKNKDNDRPHIDIVLLRGYSGSVKIDILGGICCTHGGGGPPESHARIGLRHILGLLLSSELIPQVGLESLGEVAGLTIGLFLALEHLLDTLLHQCAAVVVVHNFIITCIPTTRPYHPPTQTPRPNHSILCISIII
jgi:hypothetical protein